MRVNLWGSVWCTHAALPHLKAARGRIVAVSSLAGLVGVPGPHRLQRDQVRDDRLLRGAARRAQAGRRQRDHRLPGRRRDARSATAATTRRAEPAGTSGLTRSGAMSVEDCARLIVDGMEARRRDSRDDRARASSAASSSCSRRAWSTGMALTGAEAGGATAMNTARTAAEASRRPGCERWSHLVPAGGAVLDVACGPGRHVRWFAARGHPVTGVDRDAAALEPLRGIAGETIVADIENGPWPLAGPPLRRACVVTNYLWRPLLPAIVEASRRRRAALRDLRRRQRERRQAVAARTSCCGRANCWAPARGAARRRLRGRLPRRAGAVRAAHRRRARAARGRATPARYAL